MSPLNITQPLGIWSINVYNGYYKVMSNIPKIGHLPTPVSSFTHMLFFHIPILTDLIPHNLLAGNRLKTSMANLVCLSGSCLILIYKFSLIWRCFALHSNPFLFIHIFFRKIPIQQQRVCLSLLFLPENWGMQPPN